MIDRPDRKTATGSRVEKNRKKMTVTTPSIRHTSPKRHHCTTSNSCRNIQQHIFNPAAFSFVPCFSRFPSPFVSSPFAVRFRSDAAAQPAAHPDTPAEKQPQHSRNTHAAAATAAMSHSAEHEIIQPHAETQKRQPNRKSPPQRAAAAARARDQGRAVGCGDARHASAFVWLRDAA